MIADSLEKALVVGLFKGPLPLTIPSFPFLARTLFGSVVGFHCFPHLPASELAHLGLRNGTSILCLLVVLASLATCFGWEPCGCWFFICHNLQLGSSWHVLRRAASGTLVVRSCRRVQKHALQLLGKQDPMAAPKASMKDWWAHLSSSITWCIPALGHSLGAPFGGHRPQL